MHYQCSNVCCFASGKDAVRLLRVSGRYLVDSLRPRPVPISSARRRRELGWPQLDARDGLALATILESVVVVG